MTGGHRAMVPQSNESPTSWVAQSTHYLQIKYSFVFQSSKISWTYLLLNDGWRPQSHGATKERVPTSWVQYCMGCTINSPPANQIEFCLVRAQKYYEEASKPSEEITKIPMLKAYNICNRLKEGLCIKFLAMDFETFACLSWLSQ